MRTHVMSNEIAAIPWMQILAIMLGLAILFVFCTARVAAGLSPAGLPGINVQARPTDCFPKGIPNINNKVWYVDVTDISNESVQKGVKPINKIKVKTNQVPRLIKVKEVGQ